MTLEVSGRIGWVTELLTRSQKTFFKKSFYVALVGVLLGLWMWLSLFRFVQITENSKSRISLILLKSAKAGDEIVFTYPNLNSPLRTSKVYKDAKGRLTIKIGEEVKPFNEDLVVGVLAF